MNDIGAVKAALKAWHEGPELIAILQAIDAEYHDWLTLERPAHVATAELNVPPIFPLVEILGVESRPWQDGDSSAFDFDHEVLVMWTVLGDDEERVTAALERSLLATMRLCFHQLLPDVGNVPIKPGVVNYAPATATQGGLPKPFIKMGSVQLIVGTIG